MGGKFHLKLHIGSRPIANRRTRRAPSSDVKNPHRKEMFLGPNSLGHLPSQHLTSQNPSGRTPGVCLYVGGLSPLKDESLIEANL